MRHARTTYEDDLDLLVAYQQQVKRALQLLAWELRAGTADEQLLSEAILSNLTRFGLEEATNRMFFNSLVSTTPGVVNLNNRRYDATDNQIYRAVVDIQATLITIQKNTARTVVGLG